MFSGTYFHTVDAKGRIAVPRDYRDLLLKLECEDHVVVTRSSDPSATCLEIYPEPEWQDLAQRIRQMPAFATQTRQFRGFYIAAARKLMIDSQGRILLPQDLRERISLDKEAVFTGDLEKFYLWSKPNWEKWDRATEVAAMQPGFFDDVGI